VEKVYNVMMMNSKIVIAAGNGFLGTLLSTYFRDKGFSVIILARKEVHSNGNIVWKYWDGEHIDRWADELEGADAVINLAGKSVNCRYTEENKTLIRNSRLNSTRVLGKAIAQCNVPPKLWINASSATIYNESFDRLMTELDDVNSDDFSVDVCRQWEKAFNDFSFVNTRKVILRIGIVLGKEGGALMPFMNLVRSGLGGAQGNGKQYCSWIHASDFCRAVEHIINHRHAEEIYNITSPSPVPNNIFMRSLCRAMRIPFGLPVPEWVVTLGSSLIRTESELILKSRKVYPKRLLDEGFVFEFGDVNLAFMELCQKVEPKN
jgi:uncharacterized protein (TIGR01777 family)